MIQEKGQALVEYVLVTVLIVGVFSTINYFTNRGIGNMWQKLAREIAAGCPDCEPPPQIIRQ